MVLVLPQHPIGQLRPYRSAPIDAKHLKQAVQRGPNASDIANSGLVASAPKKVSLDEAIDGSEIDRPVFQPAPEMLDCECVLMQTAGAMPTSCQVFHICLKYRANGVAADASANGRSPKDLIQHERLPFCPTGQRKALGLCGVQPICVV
jgi:hypothetical protein